MKTNNKLSVKERQDDFEIWEQESESDGQIITRKELKELYNKKLQDPSLLSKKETRNDIITLITHDNLDQFNPYRNQSNVHLGYISKSFRWIETEVLLELIKSKMSSCEWSVFFYICHLTRGYCKMKTRYYRTIYDFPIYEIVEMTGYSRTSITRSIRSLKDRHMIYEVIDRGVVKYGINFRYDTWISSDVS